MDSIDWGTLPTWVSAFLTSGSLALGFYILLRDRKKEELTEARKVICWIDYDNDAHVNHVLNTTDRTVSRVRVLVELRSAANVLEPYHLANIIRPGEEATASTPRRVGDGKAVPEFIEFDDADGISWVRDLRTGLTHRASTGRQLTRRELRDRKRRLRKS
ncbi:hypothetical protein [Nocardia gamkensis]|uniref:Uncharacterized protein n=1 Tax=Nocardia gamkensis TaxID=352869 RepID=A0A7X6L808_9NOCA|nr:hypothetical protein [Nocardia gamkensis]NKY29419.1 hypothetical protein [Nocardia gamkensis]